MAVSIDRSNKKLGMSSMDSPSSSPLISPSSEKHIWSALRNRVDTLLENRQLKEEQTGGWIQDLPIKAPSVREDCLLLLRGFDSMSSSLSQLKGNLNTALQGAKELSNTSLTEVLHNDSEKREVEIEEDEEEGNKRKEKRKHETDQSSDDQGEDLDSKEDEQSTKNGGKLKKAKKLAISMASNAATLARELKSIKSDLSFMQERCALLEEENRRLREGSDKEERLEEDDLVRLQLEALLAEKSRLANENANLIRENQCLHQLVEYHQLTSSQDDISETYEQVVRGMCLDFSSPTEKDSNNGELEAPLTPRTDFGFSACLDEYYDEEQK